MTWPTIAQARAASSTPSSGQNREGWGDLIVHGPLSPSTVPTADRGTARRRTRYIVDYEAFLDERWALQPIERLAAQAALAVNPGVEAVNRYHAALGHVPAAFLVPDSEEPVSYSPHGVVVLLGHMGTTAGSALEQWSCSTSHDVIGPDIGAMPNTIGATALEAIYDAWSTVIGSSSAQSFGSEFWLDGVAYYRRNAAGHSTTGVWERYLSPTPTQGQGSGTGNQKPYQIATVVTEDAGGARKGRFGRFYLPALSSNIGSGLYNAGIVSDLLTDVATALSSVNDALNTAVGSDTELVVASALGSGENRPVRELRIGRVPDTQRRRRRSLAEAYAEVPFQTGP